MRMYNPPHPGEVIREYLGEMTVSAAAEHLGVGQVTFSRVLNGKAAVSPGMAVRLAAGCPWSGFSDQGNHEPQPVSVYPGKEALASEERASGPTAGGILNAVKRT